MKFISSWLRSSDSFVSSCIECERITHTFENWKGRTQNKPGKYFLCDEIRAGCSAVRSRESIAFFRNL